MQKKTEHLGFTLLELIAVIMVAGILAGAVVSRTFSSSHLQLQSAKDTLVIAFQTAQQRAMAQSNSVRLSLAGSVIDIRQDTNNNAIFAGDESISHGGVAFPIPLEAGVALTSAQFDFDRYGHTSAAVVTLTNGTKTLAVNVTAAGYVY